MHSLAGGFEGRSHHGETSGDSGPGVSHDIFRPIQDSFTTQETQGGMAWGLEISLACEALVPRRAETLSRRAR